MTEISERTSVTVTASTSISDVSSARAEVTLVGDNLHVVSPEGVHSVELYGSNGTLLASHRADGSEIVVLPFRGYTGVCIVNVNGRVAGKLMSK